MNYTENSCKNISQTVLSEQQHKGLILGERKEDSEQTFSLQKNTVDHFGKAGI